MTTAATEHQTPNRRRLPAIGLNDRWQCRDDNPCVRPGVPECRCAAAPFGNSD